MNKKQIKETPKHKSPGTENKKDSETKKALETKENSKDTQRAQEKDKKTIYFFS